MSYQIPAFRAEVEAGVADLVRSNASVAYCVEAEPLDGDCGLASRLAAAAEGHRPPASDEAPPGDPDLFLIRDVLATVCWNLNDDVFEKAETWAARHTSDNKPFNFGHDQGDIIGFIAGSEAVDAAMAPLDDSLPLDEVPAKFHVVNGSVIWRNVGSPERVALIERTVAEIRDRQWCVSMECFFRGFDYAVQAPDGTQRVVARGGETAFLTKHLRAYGGAGVYRDAETGREYRLGRVLRNITFCGKGLVRRPANPDSVILSSAASFNPSYDDPVYLMPGQETPPDTTVEPTMPEPTADLTALLAEARAANERLVRELNDLRSQGTEAALSALKADVAARDEKVAGLSTQVDAIAAAAAAATKRAEDAEASLASASAELSALKAEKARAARLAVASAAGLDAGKSAELVDSLAALGDEAFASTVRIVASAQPKPAPGPSETERIDLSTPEPDAALAAATEPDAESTRAAMADWFENNLLIKRPTGRKASE